MTETPVDAWADIMWRDPNGTIVLIQVKNNIQPTLNPGARWMADIYQWLTAHSDDGARSFDELPARHFDQGSARNVTAAATSAYLIAAAVLEGVAIRDVRKASEKLTQLLDRPEHRVDQFRPLDTDTYNVAAWLTPVGARRGYLKPTVVGSVDQVLPVAASVLERELTDLLSRWGEVAHGLAPAEGLQQRPGRLNRHRQHDVLCAVAAARQARQAALHARDAVVNQPWQDSKEAVARFTEDWLNLQPTDGLVNATANALLFASLDDPDPDPDDRDTLGGRGLLDRLRNETILQHRALRLLGETQLCGKPVDYLDRQIQSPVTDDDSPQLRDHIADPQKVEDIVCLGIGRWSDDRVARVLGKLKEDEYRVAVVWAEQGCTWAQAAEMCGLPEKYGVRVRRRLRRLGKELLDRAEKSAA
ncbi:hypothetical protein [Gandjariella thermophila]|uniref:Uncharacterized protein n=1 Tax=Gandjariella thermophila TaxID=1931992 RepID=A0A4D4JDW3_9PSEU|nr:hypothetical protein [Gandjariella thermophila]GDY33220.1 hypothetical protein GTS_48530 [Gandjariella thermophila]